MCFSSVIALFAWFAAVCVRAESLYLIPRENNVFAGWDDPTDRVYEFLLIWYPVGKRVLGGIRFLDFLTRSTVVKNLMRCTTYDFTLYGFDFEYNHRMIGTDRVRTGNCDQTHREESRLIPYEPFV
ncbi:unnamed protein product [Calicophoron daubneyi]|uniref:Uncharacterized protein n=1 Tax=Calicophoron daubneyi TaxID=300641 RepID=A0AAV2T5W5_CALDB